MGIRRGMLLFGLLMAIVCLTAPLAPAQQTQQITINPADAKTEADGHILPRVPSPESHMQYEGSSILLTPDQRKNLMKDRLERSKNDAAELAALANELRQELSQAHPNLHSANIAYRLERIEKLARKIREETTGF